MPISRFKFIDPLFESRDFVRKILVISRCLLKSKYRRNIYVSSEIESTRRTKNEGERPQPFTLTGNLMFARLL